MNKQEQVAFKDRYTKAFEKAQLLYCEKNGLMPADAYRVFVLDVVASQETIDKLWECCSWGVPFVADPEMGNNVSFNLSVGPAKAV